MTDTTYIDKQVQRLSGVRALIEAPGGAAQPWFTMRFMLQSLEASRLAAAGASALNFNARYRTKAPRTG